MIDQLHEAWAGCNAVHPLFSVSADRAGSLYRWFMAGQVNDVLYWLNMVDSRNIPFIDCVNSMMETFT